MNSKITFYFSLLTFYVLLFSFFSCTSSQSDWKLSQGEVFGTTYGIRYEAKEDFQEAFDSAFLAINQSMSTYDSSSLISKLNSGEKQVLDPMFVEVFTRAKEYNEVTKGYLDPTIGDVVNAWGFGAKEKLAQIDSVKIDSLMRFVGIQNLKIENNQLIKKYPQTYLEFNAFAKGYALDIVARILDQHKVQNYLIEIGGEIRCKGTNTKGKHWLVGIDKPVENTIHGELSAKATLFNQSMATSGNYRKYYEDEKGNKYVHTIDPHTGYPARSNLLSAVVIAEDCMTADAYATAFMAMGMEKVQLFLSENPTIQSMLLYADKQGEIKIWTTKDFPMVK